jgi:aspartate carbamoyltransferase catalytic subunit
LENLLSLYKNIDIDYFPYPSCEKESVNNITNYDNIHKYDVVYMTRLQKERFANSNINIDNFILTKDIVKNMKEDAIILHPLPRNEELDVSVDDCKQAKYLDEQMKNGVLIRMAILYHHLNTTNNI